MLEHYIDVLAGSVPSAVAISGKYSANASGVAVDSTGNSAVADHTTEEAAKQSKAINYEKLRGHVQMADYQQEEHPESISRRGGHILRPWLSGLAR